MYHYSLERLYKLFSKHPVKRPNGITTKFPNWLWNQARLLRGRGLMVKGSEAHQWLKKGWSTRENFEVILDQAFISAKKNETHFPYDLTPDQIVEMCEMVRIPAHEDDRVKNIKPSGVKLTVSDNLNSFQPIESKKKLTISEPLFADDIFEAEPDPIFGMPILQHSFTPSEEPPKKEVDMSNWVSSRKIAEVLEREHKNILAAIRNFESSPEFTRLNIQPCTYIGENGKELPEFIMSPDAFIWLITELRGHGELKEKVINDYKDAREKRDGPKTIEEQFYEQAKINLEHSRRIKLVETKTTEIEVKVDDIDAKVKQHDDIIKNNHTDSLKEQLKKREAVSMKEALSLIPGFTNREGQLKQALLSLGHDFTEPFAYYNKHNKWVPPAAFPKKKNLTDAIEAFLDSMSLVTETKMLYRFETPHLKQIIELNKHTCNNNLSYRRVWIPIVRRKKAKNES